MKRVRISAMAIAVAIAVAAFGAPAAGQVEGTIGGVEVERYAGNGRIETALAVSQGTFSSADVVLLARADQYADALVGAPLAAKLGGPILLTPGDTLPDTVRAEIDRLAPEEVILLGGEAALSPGILTSLGGGDFSVRRISGPNRFATAEAVAEELDGSTVFVAEGANASPARGWPDALSIAPLAAHLGHPILLVTADTLPDPTAAAMTTAGTTDVVIAGGTAAVGEDVASQLAQGRSMRRLAGDSRFATSAVIYDEAVAEGMSPSGRWLATGANFPDALAAGPAVAATGETLLLVDGQDLAGVPDIAERLQRDCEDLGRVVLLGGTAVISASAVDQLRGLLAAVGCDQGGGPGPGPDPNIGDSCVDEAFPAGLLDIVEDLDPDGDPDGDGFTTAQERTTLAFDPVADPARFNPLVADVPRLGIEVNDDTTLALIDATGETQDVRNLTVNETETSESTTDSVTDTIAMTHTVGVGGEGSAAGFTGSANYQYEHATTNEVTSSTTTEERTRVAQEFETIVGTSYELTGGTVSVSAEITNTGDVDFKLDDVALQIDHIDQAGNLSIIGTAEPDAFPDTGVELLAGRSVRLVFTTGELGASDIQFVAEDLAALRISIQEGFTLSSIGAVGLTAQTQSFGQYQQTVRQNTAALTIDHEPGGNKQDVFVSTTFRRNDDGTPAGVTLCEAIGTILGEQADITNPEQYTLPGGEEVEVEVLAGLTQSSGGVTMAFDRDADANAYWVTGTDSASVAGAEAFDFGDVLLRAQEGVRLVYLRDEDGDGLTSRDEVQRHGTSDMDEDSDGDGTDDGTEVRDSWDVEVDGRAAETVYSDPAVADLDGDGWNDARERREGTHPFVTDTDGDTIADPDDLAPLDPAVGGELATPVAWYAFDADPTSEDPDDGVFLDSSGNGNHARGDLDGGGSGERGPVPDRFNEPDRAWQPGQSIPSVEQPNVNAPHLDFGGTFTLSAWINIHTITDEDELIAGQPGFMGLSLGSGGAEDGQIRFGPVECGADDCPTPVDPPTLPARLSADIDLWNDLGGGNREGIWRLVTGVAQPATEGGVDGVRLTIYVDDQLAVSEFQAGVSTTNPNDDCIFVMAYAVADCFGTNPSGGNNGTGWNPTDNNNSGGLDDIRVYDDALRPDQIVTLYHERGYDS